MTEATGSLRRKIEDPSASAADNARRREAKARPQPSLKESAAPPPLPEPSVEKILLTVTRLTTFLGPTQLTRATGFFFRRDDRLYIVTSRHVLIDEATAHLPDRIEFELHVDGANLAHAANISLPLYANAKAAWHQGCDTGGDIDVAALEVPPEVLAPNAVLAALEPAHLLQPTERPVIGSALLILGFPLSFHDTLHHLPVARSATLASSIGLRFQGQGYFLTDARMHRGASGAPVLLHAPDRAADPSGLPWKLLGVHSSRMDMEGRDSVEDEALGLNVSWYADILMTLTDERPSEEGAPTARA